MIKKDLKPFFVYLILLLLITSGYASAQQESLKTPSLSLGWSKDTDGWKLKHVAAKSGKLWKSAATPSGAYTLLYAAQQPDRGADFSWATPNTKDFPGKEFKYVVGTWKEAIRPANLNTAGEAYHFYPESVTSSNGHLSFSKELPIGLLTAKWQADPNFATDLQVTVTIKAKKDGYFSIASPTLSSFAEKALTWAVLPGYWQGKAIQKDFPLAYAYGQGIPALPVVVPERTASTLAPVISSDGLSLGVIADPGIGRDPWTDKNNQKEVNLGLSLMNRKGELTPTLYHPVLGEKGSFLKAGEEVSLNFRYSLQAADWYTVYQHAIYDVYKFADFLNLKQTKQSLSDRVLAIRNYVTDERASLWNLEEYKGLKIGAQSYKSGVVGSDNDAMKNSDYGAMWMLAVMTGDTVSQKTRLPYVRNFKLLQQDTENDFMNGAAIGQYYLSKSKYFTEEWGTHVEPISLTYYIMLDIGNMLLFNPKDEELKKRLRLGAERLLKWQQADGGWELAYDKITKRPVYTDLKDLRPTFYGLIVAYKMLGDQKYLTAAVKGAEWFIQNAVKTGHFTGVCGDVRFVNDFATGQSAQSLLDLYDLTKNKTFRDAAIEVARIYTASIYTHPIPTSRTKVVNGLKWADWQLSQVGLSFEHGGTMGSANASGPILLCSHAGMFLRFYELTDDKLFRDMARAAALGRDAFIDPKTNVASYYWGAMNNGPGSFPHHAWWQVGWIVDYLIEEAHLRSKGAVQFPSGFITPKVGPHKTYGFANGKVNGVSASLKLVAGMVEISDPNIDHLAALSADGKQLFLILLNSTAQQRDCRAAIDLSKLGLGKSIPVTEKAVAITSFGIQILTFHL